MNGLEERLTDALRAVGETVRPEDVPPPRWTKRRAAVFPRALAVPLAAAATVVVTAAGVSAGFLLTGDDENRSALARPSASAGAKVDVSVFFCVKTSANPSCKEQDATQAEKDAVIARVKRSQWVQRIKYESKQEAYDRFKDRFAESLPQSLRTGDIPDGLRIWVTDRGKAAEVRALALGMPGVDTAVTE